ncbi:MAG TPA: M48 family metallopeptidase [Gaiellaceae bacterium]|nr:M48 family metallopeptidase [Gaiellaceae bacterium]
MSWLKIILARPLIALVLAGAVVGFLYLHAERDTTPVTHRTERVALSDEEQMQLGAQDYAKTLTKERANIISSGPQYEMVQRVAKRITAVAAADKPQFKWEVTLIRSKQVNAYCLPGGKIVVYTGILPLTENDAGLATVLGHEVSHATAEHGAERLQQQKMTNAAAAILAGGVAFTPDQYLRVRVLLGAASTALSLPWSRDQESEADHIGLVYMARAGYRPREALAFWQRMDKASKSDPPEFLSDHPSDANRVKRIRGWLPEAEREYRPPSG